MHFLLTGGRVFNRYMDLEDKTWTLCRNRPPHHDQLNPGVGPQHAVKVWWMAVHQQMGDTFGHVCQPDHILNITSSDEWNDNISHFVYLTTEGGRKWRLKEWSFAAKAYGIDWICFNLQLQGHASGRKQEQYLRQVLCKWSRLSRNTSVKFSKALFTAWGPAEFLLLLHNVWVNRLADIMFTFFHNFSYSLFHKQPTQL